MFFSFPNSSIAGIFWASVLVFLLPLLFWEWKKFSIQNTLHFIAGLAIIICFNSRAGLFGFISGCLFIVLSIRGKSSKKKSYRWLILSCLASLLPALYLYKINSSRGRLHIYSISLKMLEENWLWGIGFGKFKARFNEYQADYFSVNSIDNKRALLADNTFYAFNDTLQWVIEMGLPGVLGLILVLWSLIAKARMLIRSSKSNIIVNSSVGSLICIAVSSLFSYPLQVLPIQLFTFFCTGVILFSTGNVIGNSHLLVWFTVFLRASLIMLFIFFCTNSILEIKRKQIEKDAFEFSITGYKTEAMNRYKRLKAFYPINGHNIYLYAQQLYYTKQYKEALETIQHCKKHYVDNDCYTLEARIESELGMYKEAEKSYLRAIYMVPNRMASRFNLLKFYLERGDMANAGYWAKSILNMPVKVPSERTQNMLEETKKTLRKLLTD